MSAANNLGDMPPDQRPPSEKMREALALYEEGVAMQRLTFQRQYPDLTASELDALLDRWLARETDEDC